MQLGHPIWLAALWSTPVLLLLFAVVMRRRSVLLNRLAETSLLAQIGAVTSSGRHWLRAACHVAALAALVVALARPQWNPQRTNVQRQGRDVVFLIDVSRSMLARDLAPNRLERAKLWVNDLVSSLRGDRVGLVAFAGAATIRCPLTLDYSFFSLALDELDTNSVPVGGTNIGDAIRKTVGTVFEADTGSKASYRDIILITDGEDQESLPIDAAADAATKGVRIIAIGIGSEGDGSGIVVQDETGNERTLRHQGREVRSRLDAATLQEIATASLDGAYLHVGTGSIDLDQVYGELVRSAAQATVDDAQTVQFTEGFQWCVLAALLALSMELFVHDRSKTTT